MTPYELGRREDARRWARVAVQERATAATINTNVAPPKRLPGMSIETFDALHKLAATRQRQRARALKRCEIARNLASKYRRPA